MTNTLSPSTTAAVTGSNDVLQSDHRSRLTTQDIAKAVARHQREHPTKAAAGAAKAQKTSPRK
jgi:hypothetical protein